MLDRHLGQADVPDLALALQRGELADLVLQRNLGVDAVQLQQVDTLDAEVAQVELHLLTQVLGRPTGTHRPGPCRVKPTLVAITRPSG